jgi:transposase
MDQFHGYGRPLTLRHLSILGRKVWIRIRPKRYRCANCDNHPTTTQQLSWYEPNSPHTRAYDEYLMKCLLNSTLSDVSRKEEVGYGAVEGALGRCVEHEVNWDDVETLSVIGLDEIALRKGKGDFVLIVSAQQAEGVAILAVLPDRKKATVRTFFESIPERLRPTLASVCTDMWDGYINAAREFEAAHDDVTLQVVVDRFHVVQAYRRAVDKLRKQVQRQLKQTLSAEAYAELKGVHTVLRQNNADLRDEQRQQLRRLFAYAPDLKQAYTLREELPALFEMPLSRQEAIRRLDVWQAKGQRSGLTCFNAFLKTLTNWREEIVNYFSERLSSGFVEGLNNKIKTIKRRCYGMTQVGHLFQRILLDLTGFARFT